MSASIGPVLITIDRTFASVLNPQPHALSTHLRVGLYSSQVSYVIHSDKGALADAGYHILSNYSVIGGHNPVHLSDHLIIRGLDERLRPL